jgi:hypothetical protein
VTSARRSGRGAPVVARLAVVIAIAAVLFVIGTRWFFMNPALEVAWVFQLVYLKCNLPQNAKKTGNCERFHV